MSDANLRQSFLEGMSRAACTVSVVTTDGPAGRAGVTVSAMASVSADGPRPCLLVCLHHLSPAAAAIERNGVFCVNLLCAEQSAVSDVFAGRVKRPDGDKFAGFAWRRLESGAPALEDALVTFDCRRLQSVALGTHHVFFGEVLEVRNGAPGQAALIYANRSYGMPVPLKEF